MSTEAQWYVMQEDQQLGPYTGEQLVSFATGGNITRESLVWAEGMENWLPAGEVEGVFPVQAQPVAQATASPAGFNVNPYAAPATGMTTQTVQPGGEYPHVSVKGASFGMWLGLLLTAVALIIIPIALIGSQGDRMSNGAAGILSILMIGGYVLNLFVAILGYIYLYRVWKCIENGGFARASAGKAIGFMFIPLFNLYWIFQAFYGLSVDWNKTVEAYPELAPAPRLSEGLFMTFCILMIVFYPVAIFLAFPVMAQICKGINFFAFRPTKHLGGTGFSLR
ncbi:hypothetical protein HAHE_36700 [Haloferula helveola]|uniref:GYF domain-containing protein n=1 Tax=Haloferula helveola TaxID=490095 RepID=A0ABN6HBA5_9BACT|nr:hypothetical protein HAHE_36700 [Haloferula helveola]